MSIDTITEFALFAKVTSGSVLLCLRLIVGVVGRGIIEAIFYTESDAELSFRIIIELVIVEERENSVI